MATASRQKLADSTAILLEYLSVSEEPSPFDIIRGLGGNDTSVAKKAAELFRGGFSGLIIFSGGKGRRRTELAGTDAGLFKLVALKLWQSVL